mmetsp:Transcript_7259/g.13780  ORF Transcript_7259/g.13780 Transcript_7259/m.13780 type:complete len:629 (-) Transcript_7259:61-1947(-)|eukprot:CAMPEP_0175177214 /NCGR_PEP_ID=MMETSP0087-20121206/34258_1 /TAXON_ID=136419 /ORGANISM="Unknown Unknown, Strain D1" /LENGTH=628 /DNA_ID=CAMNT_0016469159 /DNA_START=67 /DNA_END=1953 /DNA_ORIENTATION=+
MNRVLFFVLSLSPFAHALLHESTYFSFSPGPFVDVRSKAADHVQKASGLQNLSASIIRLAEKVAQDWNVTGIGVGVVENGTTIFAGGVGYADKGAQKLVDGNTLFQIASTSKAFTSMLALIGMEKNKLDIDAPVTDILPDWKLTPTDTAGTPTKLLTLRDLLSHRTGLPRHDVAGFSAPTREDLLARLKYQAMDKPIRYSGEYSNEMFTSAGVAAAATFKHGQTWEEAIVDEVFKPLGMSSTYPNMSSVPQQVRTNLSKGYSAGNVVPGLDIDVSAPAGGIVSNVNDLLAWVKLHLRQSAQLVNRTVLPGPLLLKPATYANTLKGNTPFAMYTTSDEYTLGWWSSIVRQEEIEKEVLIFHGGNLPGFATNIGFLPNAGHGVIVLTNEANSFARDVLLLGIVDLLLGCQATGCVNYTPIYKDAAAAAAKAVEAANQALQQKIANSKNKVPKFPLSTYVGDYLGVNYGMPGYTVNLKNAGSGASEFLQICGPLLADPQKPWATNCLPLCHLFNDTFSFAPPGPECSKAAVAGALTVTFESSSGRVNAFLIPLEAAVAPIVFPKKGINAPTSLPAPTAVAPTVATPEKSNALTYSVGSAVGGVVVGAAVTYLFMRSRKKSQPLLSDYHVMS